MKPAWIFPLSFLLAWMLAFTVHQKNTIPGTSPLQILDKKKNGVRCSPDWNVLSAFLEETDIPPVPGAGIYRWKILTQNDSAQFYFNQGINMYYGFHIIEAMASFKKARKFDSGCAMIYWAEALTYGPNINDFGYRASTEALEALNKSIQLSANASPFEKALIDAMSVRYTGDSADVTRALLNERYTQKMKEVARTFQQNPDALALYADAMMLEHPWDLWYVNGNPKPWTPRIRETLEKLLVLYPDHPGGNHYYIHVMEPSPYAAKAMPSAARLGRTNPGLSHLVHMPSHIYLRTGKYQAGIDVNIQAVNSYRQSLSLYEPAAGADFLYKIHNLHMKTNQALMAGNFRLAESAAKETRNSIPEDYLSTPAPMGSYIQYIHMTPVLVYIRFGKWDALMQMPAPEKSRVYENILYHFGRGMAFSYRKDFESASAELDQMRVQMKDSGLRIPFTPFSSAWEGARVAEEILLGVIHDQRGQQDGAVRHFRAADSIERNMVYNEPRDWILNPKHFLGDAYLEMEKGKEAEQVFRKDLSYNNENGWALAGLYKSLVMQKKKTAIADVKQRLKNASSHADIDFMKSGY